MAVVSADIQTLRGKQQSRVASFVLSAVQNGTFRPGDKVPSVREMAHRLDVSVTTVVEAYRQLETEGLIRAQPQSGFYVQIAAARRSEPAARTEPASVPSDFTAKDLFLSVFDIPADPHLRHLAGARPSLEVIPVRTLNRMVTAAMRNSPAIGIEYAPPEGLRPLREQIARRSLAAGCALAPDELVVTNGCTEALSLCLRAVTSPGDIVAIESPAYYGLLHSLSDYGLRVLEIGTDARQGMCLESLERAIDEHPVKAVLATPNFNNPIGSLMPDDRKQRLVQLLASREIPLIEDDVYGELSFDTERPIVCKAYDRHGLVLHCSSFSKTLAPGFRIGWVSGGRWHRRIRELKFSSSVSSCSLVQAATAEFLQYQRFPHYVRKASALYRENIREITRSTTEAFPDGTTCSDPQGGMVVWICMPEAFDSIRLHRLAAERGIVFMPGPVFSTQRLYRNCLRLNAGAWNDRIDRAVRWLGRTASECLTA